jgi:hypothetical protein
MQLEEQVTGVTGQLEAAMRRTIDAEVKVDSLAGVMGRFETEAEQASLAPRRATRRTRRHINADEDGDDDGDGDDADYDPAEGEGAEAPSQKLQTSLAESNARWDGLSLTERYAPPACLHERMATNEPDTRPTTPTSASTGSSTKPNTPATTSRRSRTPRRGSRTWKSRPAPPRTSTGIARAHGVANALAARPPPTRTTSPSSASASRSSAL